MPKNKQQIVFKCCCFCLCYDYVWLVNMLKMFYVFKAGSTPKSILLKPPIWSRMLLSQANLPKAGGCHSSDENNIRFENAMENMHI